MIKYYQKENGDKPYKDFLNSIRNERKLLHKIETYLILLNNVGLNLNSNYLKQIDNKLWELRPDRVRIFLTIYRNDYILLSAYYKKTQKLPENELIRARKYRDDFLERISK